ncbi:MAG: response regulator transcription factor [Pseudomonadota bacterium]
MLAEHAITDDAGYGAGRPRRVMVVDDHPLFCDALSMTLSHALPSARIVTASRLSEALDRIAAEGAPDAIMLDLNLPDVEGFDGLARLRAAAPDARILVVSSMSANEIIASALDCGANGFMPKDATRSVMMQALDRLWAGESVVPEGFVRPENGSADAALIERMQQLTPRQTRILELVCLGKLNKQIAYDLSISETTVKAHVTAILRKLGVASRTQAVLAVQKARFATVLKDGSASA